MTTSPLTNTKRSYTVTVAEGDSPAASQQTVDLLPSAALTLAAAADPGVSYWLRDALQRAARRDPLDALRDAEVLLAFCWQQLETQP